MERKETDYYRDVCIYELERNHGSFLTTFMEAFLRADHENVCILLDPMKKLAEKYKLRKEDETEETEPPKETEPARARDEIEDLEGIEDLEES